MVDIMYRPEWGHTAPLYGPMRLPVGGVHVHHSVTSVTGDVTRDMRTIERAGVERFGRFSYSYCGHPSGVIGEGAGLTVGAHTAGWNSTSLGFCLIGNYDDLWVTDAQVRAFLEWRRDMVHNRFLVPNHWIEPHHARKATACPGRNTMRRWPELTASLSTLATTPAPQEDDMPTLVTNKERGIWVLTGDTMVHLTTPEAVAKWLATGVKVLEDYPTGDFAALVTATGAAEYEASATNLQLVDIRNRMGDILEEAARVNATPEGT